MLKTLQLGNRNFPSNIIQGPLAGFSSAPFRLLTWTQSKPAFTCTEMISCKTLIYQSKSSQRRYITKDPQEGNLCFQLAGNDPRELAEATKIATAAGADLIDLNCGCPVKKIRSKGAGSKLLSDFSKLYLLIRAMKENTHVPVSIKIRVDGQSNENFNASIIHAIHDSGLDFVIVHGRHWTETYEVACSHSEIKFFVDHLNIPVIGNGDISCVDTLKKMLTTGCAGVMISRAGVGQPWLIKKLITELNGETFPNPDLKQTGEFFIEHVQGLEQLLQSEKFSLLHARKFAKYYARNLPQRIAFCDAVNHCKTLTELKTLTRGYFK